MISFTRSRSRLRIKYSRSRSRPKTGRLRNPVFNNNKKTYFFKFQEFTVRKKINGLQLCNTVTLQLVCNN